jgi:hypothetical protein
MTFRVTIEQHIHPNCGAPDCEDAGSQWVKIKQEIVKIHVAEKAARQIHKLIMDEGLDANLSELRKVLFEELHERDEELQ